MRRISMNGQVWHKDIHNKNHKTQAKKIVINPSRMYVEQNLTFYACIYYLCISFAY